MDIGQAVSAEIKGTEDLTAGLRLQGYIDSAAACVQGEPCTADGACIVTSDAGPDPYGCTDVEIIPGYKRPTPPAGSSGDQLCGAGEALGASGAMVGGGEFFFLLALAPETDGLSLAIGSLFGGLTFGVGAGFGAGSLGYGPFAC